MGLGIASLLIMVYIVGLTNFAKMLELGPALSSLHYLGNFKKATVMEWGVKIVMSVNGLSQIVPKRGLLCLKVK